MKYWKIGLVWLIAATWLAGQSQSNTADLTGYIRDQSGAVLPGVSITAAQIETGFTRTTVSEDSGNYRLVLLPPGSYQVRAELPGFATKVQQGVNLTVGQVANLDLVLEVSATQTEIVVMGDASILEAERTVQASTIEKVQIDNLPINGRNYLDFSLLTPGVSGPNSMVNFSAVQAPTSGLSFAGQDQRSNNVTIDGADNMDVISNAVRSTISQEAIQEFQIARNTFSAEFGRSRGGVINIVSKSGSSNFHGNAFFFFRNDSLDARNPFAFGSEGRAIDPPFERYQWGGTFGGPIIRDRTFFYLSYEGLDRDESIFVTFLDDPGIFRATSSQQQLFDFLGAVPVPQLQGLAQAFAHPQFGILNTTPATFPNTVDLFERESGAFPFRADSDNFSLKLDHLLSDANQLFFRLNVTDSFDDGINFGALEGISNGVSFETNDVGMVISDSHVFSPATLNDFKFQFARRSFGVATNDPVGPEIVIAGVAEFGREFFNPSRYSEKVVQLTDNLNLIAGNHTLKTGVDLNIMNLSGFAEVFLGGQFSFAEAVPLGAIFDRVAGPGTVQGLGVQLATPAAAGGLGRPDLVPNLSAPLTAVQAFNLGLPVTYFQGFGNPSTKFNYYQMGLYLQDSWKIQPNFTLNLGVRYDVDWRIETLNVVSNTPPFELESATSGDYNNFGPRVGFAWDPGNSQKTVIRGGYGVYYQNFFQAVAFVSQVLSGRIRQVFLPLTGIPGIGATSAEIFGFYRATGQLGQAALDTFNINPGTTPSVILPGSPDAANPYSHHASLGVERKLSADANLELDYVLNRGVHLIRSRDVNVRAVGPNRFALPALDPRFIQINMVETSGSSIYHGFSLSLRKRFARNYSTMASYTLGKVIDDTTDFITPLQPNDQTDLGAERSLSSFDQRHRLVVSGLPYRLSRGKGFFGNLVADWTIAPIVTWNRGGRLTFWWGLT